MAIINYTAEQINAILASAQAAPTQQDVDDAITGRVGNLAELLTDDKDSCVDAINENFTNADEGKTVVVASLIGKGESAATTDTWDTLSEKIDNLKPSNYIDPSSVIRPNILNGESCTPTGTYATATYYNTTYGVKVGYLGGGRILISMRAGTTTNYENIWFTPLSLPSGVSMENDSSSYDTSNPAGQIFCCSISGLNPDKNYSLAISMNNYNGSYDYVTTQVSITEVS